MKAAGDRLMSRGAEASGFAAWLARHVAKGRYAGYDADATFRELAHTADEGTR
jgi:hypothetical protein